MAKRLLLRIWFPICIVATWQIVLNDSTNPFLPAPVKILQASQRVLTYEWIRASIFPSLETLLIGYLLGSIFAITIGGLVGANARAREIFNPLANFLRSVPSVAKVPVIMALLGIGMASRVTSVAVAVFFPVLMSTIRAVASTDEQLVDVSRIFGFSRIQSIFTVRIPAATGEILTGLHAAVQVSVLVMVVSEMLGASNGLGAFIIHSQSTFMIADMWVGALILGVLGLMLNEAFLFAERKLAPWYFSSKEIS